jgi:hypothetical protein
MAPSAKELVKSLKYSKSDLDPSIQAFPDINIDAVSDKLSLERRGMENGRMNHPDENATGMDSVEHEILDYIEKEYKAQNSIYQSQMKAYNERHQIASKYASNTVSFKLAAKQAVQDFESQVQQDKGHLEQCLNAAESRKLELDRFKKENSLNRDPVVLNKKERLLRYLILFLIVLSESIANGMFFAEGSEAGLVGGFAQAIGLALVNVAIAFVYARFVYPNRFHVYGEKRNIAMVGTLIYAIAVLYFNLFVGHYRDMYIASADLISWPELSGRLLTSPFSFSEAKSFLLFLIGCLLNVFAMLDVAWMKDKYPGFGDIGRLCKDAIDEFHVVKRACLQNLSYLRDQAHTQISEMIQNLENAEYDQQLVSDGRKRLHSLFVDYIESLRSSYNRLMKVYIESNLKHRSGKAPKRFYSEVVIPGFLSSPKLVDLSQIQSKAEKIMNDMEKHITLIDDKIKESTKEYDSIKARSIGGHE